MAFFYCNDSFFPISTITLSTNGATTTTNRHV
ncbi:uncharacterized protein METZ01_LOCUS478296, partial [marine metagenome]